MPAPALPHRRAVHHEREDFAFRGFGRIAEELGRADLLLQFEPDPLGGRLAGAGPGGAGTRALLLHRRFEAGEVHVPPLLAQRVLRQVERKAERVVQPERHGAGQRLAVAEPGGLLGQQMQPALQHLTEARLLQQQRLDDQRLGAHQFGIRGAHLAHQRRHQPIHQRLPRAHHVGVAHGAAHDPAQHVAAALVRRQHAVGDQERDAAQMVGDHPVADAERAVRVLAGRLGAGQDQRAEYVGVVVVVLALQDRGKALQPHAGVDRGSRQRRRACRAGLPRTA